MTPAERIKRIAISIGSSVVLLALLVGVPLLLIALHGRPDHPATFSGLMRLIDGDRVQTDAVVDAITAMAWCAWLVIALAIVAEVVGWIRGRPTPHLGVAGPFQPVARNLVATAALLIGTLGAPPRSGALQVVSTAAATPAVQPAAAPTPAAVVAEAPSPAPAAPPSCTVVPRDTLWGLAEAHLGDPLRWREIYELNHGRSQPDGRHLEDPNLIIPGWNLQLPDDAIGVTPAPPPPTAEPPAPSPISTTPPVVAVPTAPPTTPSDTSNPTTPSREHGSTHADSRGTASRDETTDIAVSAIAAAGIVALLSALRLARRRQRRPVTHPERSTERVETALRRAISSEDRLDHSLRAFGRSLRATDSSDVRLLAVRDLDTATEILVATPLTEPPDGFVPTDDPRGWITEPELTTDRLRQLADGEAAPAPCLVSIGTLDDDTLLIDLETAGLLTIEGPDTYVASVLRHLAIELATSTIADHIQVLVVGEHILGDIGDAHPRVRHLDLTEAVAELEAAGRENRSATGPDGESNLVCPTVLVSFEPIDTELLDRIDTFATDHRRRVAAVVPSTTPSTWHLEIQEASMRLAPLGLALVPFTLDTAAADEIEKLIAEPDDDHSDDVADPEVTDRPAPTAISPLADPPFDLEIRVLGPVDVTGAARPFARHRHLEIAVYLAMHPDGVSDERLKTALWPDQAPKTATFNTAISTTRSGLGRDSSGEPHFSHFAAANRRYRLGARATSDYARFAARVEHARSASADAAVADLRSALELVRGQPFAEIHGFEWAWSEGFVATIETAVAKAAHDLAQRYLERGDSDGAIWAAMRGLVAAPADEILYRDRMLACDLAGNPAGVETVMRELQHAVEAVEPWDGIHPETIALYDRLRRRGTRPRPKPQNPRAAGATR